MSHSTKATFIFLLFAAFWGASFPVAQSVLNHIGPYYFVFVRFAVAALVLLPFIFQPVHNTQQLIKAGIVLGVLNTAIYGFEILSLQYTASARCSFITGTSVIFAPFVTLLFRKSAVEIIDIIAAVICCIGLYILTGAHFEHINIGDYFALIGAISIGISLNCVQSFSDRDFDSRWLTFFQLAFTCPIPFLISAATKTIIQIKTFHLWVPVLFCSILATALPLLGQMKWQKHLSATKAALLFAMEPVFTVIVAHYFYREAVPLNTIIGGALIFISVIVSTVLRS